MDEHEVTGESDDGIHNQYDYSEAASFYLSPVTCLETLIPSQGMTIPILYPSRWRQSATSV